MLLQCLVFKTPTEVGMWNPVYQVYRVMGSIMPPLMSEPAPVLLRIMTLKALSLR
uniref:Uncharacterized protein n=1 Tax=uncultured marine virus TaxID=186617 RepID=A0A0F7L008_9VIRU|nr:hypothetical protein [uncultured marine virus]